MRPSISRLDIIVGTIAKAAAARAMTRKLMHLFPDGYLWHARILACRSDGGNDPVRGDRRYQNLRAEALEGIVDGIDDGGRRSNGAAFADTLLSEPGIGRRRLHVDDANAGNLGGARNKIVSEVSARRLSVGV